MLLIANGISTIRDLLCFSNYRHLSIDFSPFAPGQMGNSLLQKHRRHRSLRKSVSYRDNAFARERHSLWHTAITVLRSQRWAGSASMRGCHIADTAISGVRTGSSKL